MLKTLVPRCLRILLIVVLTTLCLGLIVHSARSVRYSVDGVAKTEVAVTELSLTHSVEHTASGGFTNPYAAPDQQELAAKKPIPKKPAPKKPTPKKPVPKRPGGGKACPT